MKSKSLSKSGVALIIVLGFLVIITGLAVAFFTSVSTELQASRNFASGVTTRQLADSAVGVVMGQLREATTRPNSTWASQPGMLRVYGEAGAVSHKLDSLYKLYSSNNMVVSSTDAPTFLANDFQNDLDAAWNTKPAFWTDLNSPILVPDTSNPTQTVPRFPIIDPRAYAIQATNAYSTVPAAGTAATDPKWKNIEGFWYNAAATVNGIVGPAATDVDKDKQRLPMPTRWIYVLQDGTLTVPDTGDGKSVSWSAPAKSPTKANPIVGRVAFWTDDETSKVNLNTAGGYADVTLPTGYDANSHAGSFWDTPRFYTAFDRGMPAPESNGATGNPPAGTPVAGGGGLAICQLLQGEYQRYPGHPGTTSLGLIFRKFLTSEQLYSILPRLGTTNSTGSLPGSTEGGTKRVIPFNGPMNEGNANPIPNDFQIQPKRQRLYASVDELLFAANKAAADPGITDPAYHRQTNDLALKNNSPTYTGGMTPELLDKMRFFITAQSRAPELNLFGRPRVTVWPVRAENATESSGLNAFDNLILFCSTIGQGSGGRPDTTATPATSGLYRYIFTRRELPTATQDADDGQWKLPATFVRDADRPRNEQLLTYLKNLTEKQIPGFGGITFKDKLGEDNRNTVLAEIFDYILCANSKDTTTKTIDGTSTAKPFAPAGITMPSKIEYLKPGTSYKGVGRFPTISEASLVFYYAGPKMVAADATSAPKAGVAVGTPIVDVDEGFPPLPSSGTGRPKANRMGCFLLLSTFNPMQGYSPIGDPAENGAKLSFEIDDGLSKLRVNWLRADGITPASANLGFPAKDPYNNNLPISTTVYRCSNSTWAGRNIGGFEGFMHTLVGRGSALAPHKIKAGKSGFPLDPQYRTGPGTMRAVDYFALSDTDKKLEALLPPDSGNADQNIKNDNNLPLPAENVFNNQEWYQFQSQSLIEIDNPSDPTLNARPPVFWLDTGGTGKVVVTVKYGGLEVQKITLKFEPNSAGWPVPRGDPSWLPDGKPTQIDLRYVAKPTFPETAVKPPAAADAAKYIDLRDPSKWMTVGQTGTSPNGAPIGINKWQAWLTAMKSCYWSDNGSFYPDYVRAKNTAAAWAPSHLQTTLQASWSFASRLAWSMQHSHENFKNPYTSPTLNNYGNRWKQIVQPGDTIRSLVYCDANNGSVIGGKSGDLRVLAVSAEATTGFEKHPNYMGTTSRACLLRAADGNMYFPPGARAKDGGGTWQTPAGSGTPNGSGGTTPTTDAPYGNHVLLGGTNKFSTSRTVGNLANAVGNTNPTINGILRDDSTSSTGPGVKAGDFDTGLGVFPDGPYVNKQDEGNVIYAWKDIYGNWHYPVPYYDATWAYEKPGNTFTSPSRQMPSAVMMGSLLRRPYSDGTVNAKGWETLCFTPAPAGPNHPGNVDPKDHLLLDLFQMPVVEPYPISEPFSTAGKVNLNYQIAPFNYITRSTALRAALHPLRVPILAANTFYNTYKTGSGTGAAGTYDANKTMPLAANPRKPVDRDKTIKAIDDFFVLGKTDSSTGFFKSATQICERFLYPIGTGATTDADMLTYWNSFATLIGDNMREKTYADLYPRVTTKSNTYTVHMKVQTLKQLPRSNAATFNTWNEGRDAVLGEYRGSTTIERYIDPADPRFNSTHSNFVNPDDVSSATSLESLYRMRTVINKRFAP